MSILLKNEKSSLIGYKMGNNLKKLIEKAIPEFEDSLRVRPEMKIYGRTVHENRNIGFFSNESIGYSYSGKIENSIPLNKYLIKILESINNYFESNYNGILVNKYVDGNDYIGKHSDNENGLDESVGVIAISFGAERIFRIRDKTNGKIVIDISTETYPIIQMKGNFQKDYTHEIPKQKKIKDARYSLTFRKHIR